jgi:MFS superfamily sulfate permease-like transporter
VLAVPVINKIPLATLATILILVGYKLAKPATFIHFGKKENINLFLYCYSGSCSNMTLKGVLLGIVISIIFILREFKRAYSLRKKNTLTVILFISI